jgi:predicted aspartyl protease
VDWAFKLTEFPRYRIVVQLSSERLEQIGPLIPGAWSRHDDELGREVRGEFLIDTGAYGVMIDLEVAESLLLSARGSREIHGIHGYGQLQQFFARISLPALENGGSRTVFTTTIECVAVPSLTAKNREHGIEVVGILGRMFLRGSRLTVDGISGRVELEISGDLNNDR